MAIGALLRGGMLLLRLAQESAIGVTSDDGFIIGQVTVSGTYALLVLGVGLGVLGTAAYIAVAPFLIGPPGCRVATVAITAMLLGGAVTIRSDGIDFTALDTELAVAVFLVVPLLSGLLVPPVLLEIFAPLGTMWSKFNRARFVCVCEREVGDLFCSAEI